MDIGQPVFYAKRAIIAQIVISEVMLAGVSAQSW